MQTYRALLLCSSLLGCSSAFAQNKIAAPSESAEPHIQFEKQIYDFGKVKAGEVVKHSFVFTNTGSSTLEILEVRPGCGCTTAGTWDKSIEPGKTGSIPLQFNSTGFGGKVAKTATVTSNDPKQPSLILQLSGTVWKAIDLNPTMAMFNFPPEGQTNESRTLRIISNIEEPLTLEEPTGLNPSFRAELKPITAGKEFELRVTALPPFTNAFTSTPIKIQTSSKEMPEISTSAYVSVMPAIAVIPQVLSIPAGPLPANTRYIVTVRNNTTNNVVVSDATISIPGATVTIQEVPASRAYTLTVNLPTGFHAEPGQKLELTAKTSYPKNPVITVPIMQPPAPAKPAATAKLAPAAK